MPQEKVDLEDFLQIAPGPDSGRVWQAFRLCEQKLVEKTHMFTWEARKKKHV